MKQELTLLLFVVLCRSLALGQRPLHRLPLSEKVLTTACEAALNATSPTDATKYMDYLGKPGSGITNGNMVALGSYDGCEKMLNSHYCFARLNISGIAAKIPLISAGWGLCVPKECGEEDIANGVETIFGYLADLAGDVNMTSPFSLGSVSPNRHVACYKETTYTTGVIITLCIIGILVSLSVAGTVLDSLDRLAIVEEGAIMTGDNNTMLPSDKIVLFYNPSNNDSQRKGGLLREILLCFSVLKNSKQLMSTSAPAGSISCINGIRVISMFWVILGHTYAFSFSGNVTDNPFSLLQTIQNFSFEPVLNGVFSVDSFFFLSGLLVGYLSWRRMAKSKGKLPLFKFYFHRFWRLTPLYMFVILFYDKMNGFLGQGPVWFTAQSNTPCDKYWWTNLLYINNFYPSGIQDECLDWSWYLANDMQFYVISPIILFAVYRLRWIGLGVTAGIFTLASIIVTAIITDVYDLSAFMFTAADGAGKYMNYIYIKPYCRIAPYLVGLALAYVFHEKVSLFKRGRRLSWIINVSGWVLATLLAVSVVYGPYSTVKLGGKPFTHVQNVFYSSLCRLTWALAIAWVVYACHHGYGGMVNSFLSASFWTPLSRMTYGAYLAHPIVLFALFLSFETPAHYTVHLFVYYFIGATVLSYGVAFVFAVFLELPLTNLEKIVFKM